MITFEKAIELAKAHKPEVDFCAEYENLYFFSITLPEGQGFDGDYYGTPVIVMKKDGSLAGISAWISEAGELIREFKVDE